MKVVPPLRALRAQRGRMHPRVGGQLAPADLAITGRCPLSNAGFLARRPDALNEIFRQDHAARVS